LNQPRAHSPKLLYKSMAIERTLYLRRHFSWYSYRLVLGSGYEPTIVCIQGGSDYRFVNSVNLHMYKLDIFFLKLGQAFLRRGVSSNRSQSNCQLVDLSADHLQTHSTIFYRGTESRRIFSCNCFTDPEPRIDFPGGMAQWFSHPPQQPKIRVQIPRI
jgi:hypothetical protein